MENKRCSVTVMDTTDPNIQFNNEGVSDYVSYFKEITLPSWNFGKGHEDFLMKKAQEIKKKHKNQDFDCIIGLSGGLDSSYTAYVAKEVMGLRPLIFHVDAGWNTVQAVENIECLVNGLDLDLYTEVINWEEMKDLQRSFLKSQIPDQDLPQDYAFFSALYKFAKKNRIKTILTGGNYSTECVREPLEWGGYPGIDKKLAKSIHKLYGEKELKTFPLIDIFQYRIFYRYINGMEVFKPLNFIPYFKEDAENTLKSKFGWKPFQHKHHESRFTRFYEDFWLKKKFGFDKRKAHFSSLILTNQMSRDEALERLQGSELSEEFLKNEFEYVANKLEFTFTELQQIFNDKNLTFNNYPNNYKWIRMGAIMAMKLGLEKRMYR